MEVRRTDMAMVTVDNTVILMRRAVTRTQDQVVTK